MLTVHRQQQCPFPAWLSPTSCSTTASTTTLPRYHVTTLPCCHIATLPHCHVATLPSYHVTTLPCYHITTLPLPHYIFRITTTTTNKKPMAPWQTLWHKSSSTAEGSFHFLVNLFCFLSAHVFEQNVTSNLSVPPFHRPMQWQSHLYHMLLS